MANPEIACTGPVGPREAPLLVLGHSLGTGPLIWEAAAPLLSGAFRVALVTLPGHGDAPVPSRPFSMEELAAAIAECARARLGDSPTALYAGVSISGALALQLGLAHAGLFSAVGCLAAGAELGTPAHWTARAATVREHSTSVLVESSSRAWFAPETTERKPEVVARILQALRDTSTEGYARCAEALAGYDLRGSLGAIRVPVLAAWGQADTVGTEVRQEQIVAGVPRARAVRIDGAAHQLPAERPAHTAAVLREFFAEVLG